MRVMSLRIISSQLCYSHVYVFDAMLIACRSQFRRHLGLYKEYTWICSKIEVEALMFVNGDNSKVKLTVTSKDGTSLKAHC